MDVKEEDGHMRFAHGQAGFTAKAAGQRSPARANLPAGRLVETPQP